MGPNGVLVTPDNHLWASTRTATVKVFDLSSAKPPFNGLSPAATISTGAVCRADELGFDPKDHVIVVRKSGRSILPFNDLFSSDARTKS